MTNAREALLAAARTRILLADGGWGAQIQTYKLDESAYIGALDLAAPQKGNNDILALTRPDIVTEIATTYLAAGSDIITTNSFNATRVSQADYRAEHLVRDINRENARLSRAAADSFAARDGKRRFVAGAVGPTNKTLSLSPDVNDPGYRAIDFDALKEVYQEQILALAEGGVDFILIETIFDTLNAKAAILAAKAVAKQIERVLPLMISMTLTDLSGRNLSGHTVEAFWCAVRHARPLTIGLNCSFGAKQLTAHVAQLARISDCLLMVYPNAGLPNDLGAYDEQPEQTAALVRQWAAKGDVNILGGCCGATPAHIVAIAQAVADCAPRSVPQLRAKTQLAGLDLLTIAA